MNRLMAVSALIISDAIGTAFAYRLSYLLRYESGAFSNTMPAEVAGPLFLLTIFWWTVFGLRGLYVQRIALSRFTEFEQVFKAVLVGTVLIYLATFDVTKPIGATRLFLANYSLLVIGFVGFGRFLISTVQRRQRSRRKGLLNAIIVGVNDVGRKLALQLDTYPIWGFRVVGYVDDKPGHLSETDPPLLGGIADLTEIAHAHQCDWVLVAPAGEPEKLLSEVLTHGSDQQLRYMLVADHYQMVIGLVRTVEIHGLPLIEVHPQLVSTTTRIVKRLLDLTFSLVVSIIILLVTPFIALAIKLDSPGPVLYSQKRMGRRGREFTLYKFRSMVQDAEIKSGAVWALKNDPRVTRIGRILRKTHLDELPQFFNVLMGQMSLVGPRPERKQFVEEFRKKIPLYERRLRVRPGITGWAQVRHKYDETLEDVFEKTRYDLFYIDHISLGLDLKIIISTALKMLSGAGH